MKIKVAECTRIFDEQAANFSLLGLSSRNIDRVTNDYYYRESFEYHNHFHVEICMNSIEGCVSIFFKPLHFDGPRYELSSIYYFLGLGSLQSYKTGCTSVKRLPSVLEARLSQLAEVLEELERRRDYLVRAIASSGKRGGKK